MIGGKRVLALIPARGGSKSIPLKNIARCDGEPLISYTTEAARNSKYIDEIVTSTDNDKIAEVALCYGSDVIDRPAHLATDEATTEAVVMHAICALDDTFDIVCLLQPTSPLRTASDIDGCLELLMSNRSAVSVCESHHVIFDGTEPKRRQDRPPTLVLNGAVYCCYVSDFMEHRAFITGQTAPYVMPQERSVDIDTQADLEYASYLLGKL